MDVLIKSIYMKATDYSIRGLEGRNEMNTLSAHLFLKATALILFISGAVYFLFSR